MNHLHKKALWHTTVMLFLKFCMPLCLITALVLSIQYLPYRRILYRSTAEVMFQVTGPVEQSKIVLNNASTIALSPNATHNINMEMSSDEFCAFEVTQTLFLCPTMERARIRLRRSMDYASKVLTVQAPPSSSILKLSVDVSDSSYSYAFAQSWANLFVDTQKWDKKLGVQVVKPRLVDKELGIPPATLVDIYREGLSPNSTSAQAVLVVGMLFGLFVAIVSALVLALVGTLAGNGLLNRSILVMSILMSFVCLTAVVLPSWGKWTEVGFYEKHEYEYSQKHVALYQKNVDLYQKNVGSSYPPDQFDWMGDQDIRKELKDTHRWSYYFGFALFLIKKQSVSTLLTVICGCWFTLYRRMSARWPAIPSAD